MIAKVVVTSSSTPPHIIQYHNSSLFQYMRTKYTLYIYNVSNAPPDQND